MQPPLPLPLAAVRMAKTLQDLSTRCEAAGLDPRDPMFLLVEGLGEAFSESVASNAEHTRQLEAMTIACRHLLDSGRIKAETDLRAMVVDLIEQIRGGIESDLSKMALRIPRQIGLLRALVAGVAGVLLLGAGLGAGAWWAHGQDETAARALRTAFAPGAPGAATMLRLYQLNDLDAALATAENSGKCGGENGRKACFVPLWVDSAPTPPTGRR